MHCTWHMRKSQHVREFELEPTLFFDFLSIFKSNGAKETKTNHANGIGNNNREGSQGDNSVVAATKENVVKSGEENEKKSEHVAKFKVKIAKNYSGASLERTR